MEKLFEVDRTHLQLLLQLRAFATRGGRFVKRGLPLLW
jgi:hypothetical protein